MDERDWELHARSGRAVLMHEASEGIDPARLPLPRPLVASLHEWAHAADAVREDEESELVSRRGRQLAMRLAAETGGQIGYVDPFTGELDQIGRPRAAHAMPRRRGGAVGPVQPTPWGPGLVVSAIVGAIVTVTLVVVTLGLADASVILAVLVNLAVAAGFAPSIWLGRHIPVWRWVAYGTAAGIIAAWLALILSLLG